MASSRTEEAVLGETLSLTRHKITVADGISPHLGGILLLRLFYSRPSVEAESFEISMNPATARLLGIRPLQAADYIEHEQFAD